MLRFSPIKLIIFAVLLAAVALAWYSYSLSQKSFAQERITIRDTLHELAMEKVLGIESQLLATDDKLFAAVNLADLARLDRVVNQLEVPVRSVFVLDEQLEVLPGGYVASRERERAEAIAFREFFEASLLPILPLREVGNDSRGHAHLVVDGLPYLFSFVRRQVDGRSHYIVVESDLLYLVGSVFPQYFDIRSPRLYQVVDDQGEIVYGWPFRGARTVVEAPFVETVDRWRVRVAERQSPAASTLGDRRVFDLTFVALALLVMIAGIVFLLAAMYRERKSIELKSEFVSNVSHELKTPLSIISMFSEMMALGRVTSAEQQQEYAQAIRRESVRLTEIIDNLLDFSRMEAAMDEQDLTQVDLASIVERALEIAEGRIARAGQTVTRALEPTVTFADEGSMFIAVINLLDNAAKYAGKGNVISVAVRRQGEQAQITVSDNGPGIAPEEQMRVFERFYRSKAARAGKSRGSGVGLALVKRIAQAHGGDVTLTSALGKGAAFTLSIPLTHTPPRRRATTQAPPPDPA